VWFEAGGIRIVKPTPEELENRFTYHKPSEEQAQTYYDIRDTARNVAYHLCAVCPDSRELSLALTALDEVVFWANAAVARHGS
jgi:hypothetical protein